MKKKKDPKRILGRNLAREMTREDLQHVQGCGKVTQRYPED